MGCFLRMSARLTNECRFSPVTTIPDQMVRFSDSFFFFNEQIPHRHLIVYLKPTCLPRVEKSCVPSWISLHVLCLALTEENSYCHGVQSLSRLNRWSQGTPRATNHIKLPLGSRASRKVVNYFPSPDTVQIHAPPSKEEQMSSSVRWATGMRVDSERFVEYKWITLILLLAEHIGQTSLEFNIALLF